MTIVDETMRAVVDVSLGVIERKACALAKAGAPVHQRTIRELLACAAELRALVPEYAPASSAVVPAYPATPLLEHQAMTAVEND